MHLVSTLFFLYVNEGEKMKEKCNTKVVFHYLSAPCASDF